MRKKYKYYVNNKECKNKKEFMEILKQHCTKVIRTDWVNEYIGIDLEDFDEKKFKENMRAIEYGTSIIFLSSGTIFSRKQIK
jgi:hypothetical protein